MTGKRTNAEVQAFYRHVNEQIAAVSRRFDARGRFEILCECGTAGCTERLVIEPGDYESIRAQPTHFALLVGHEDHSVEDVVRTADGYLVVANYGQAASVARRTDPRAGTR